MLYSEYLYAECLYAECLYAECPYAECRDLLIVMPNVVMLSVVMLSVVMLSVIMLSVITLSDVMLSVVASLNAWVAVLGGSDKHEVILYVRSFKLQNIFVFLHCLRQNRFSSLHHFQIWGWGGICTKRT